MEQEDTNVDKSSNFDKFVKDAFSVIRDGIKAANGLPNAENFNYYQCYPTFNKIRNKQAKSLVNCMQKIVKLAGVSNDIIQRDVEEKFELLLEANDILIDRAESCIDEESGFSRNPPVELIVSQTVPQKKTGPTLNGAWNKFSYNASDKITEGSSQAKAIRLLAAKNIHRPQLTFSDKVDNSFKPWKPNLRVKPNALTPLNLVADNETGEFHNPYSYELDRFEVPNEQLQKKKPIKWKDLKKTPLVRVENKSELKAMVEELKKHKEIAVDLEHHSYRSFQGITCLIQLSTRDSDYLVDALTLRSELHMLNQVFTDPSILKVFHGADSDIEWLQRDFSVYVVNMFDTHQAAKQLNLPYLSLAYLMKTYCELDPNKHFQLADWRIRPLPEELVKYAREDTHYLLYIKDVLRNNLIDLDNAKNNILKVVYSLSTEICKKNYVKPIWTEDSYLSIYRKGQKMFNNKQLYALKELHRWRDQVAREEDDSTNYVLPNHMLLNIAETLPREMQGVLACCNPIPPLVRQNLLKIHKLILKAREQSLVKSIESDLRQRMTQRTQTPNSDSWMFMPHDVSSRMEAANLVCLLDNLNNNETIEEKNKLKHITVFDSSTEDEGEDVKMSNSKKKLAFISPFKRYKLVLPIVAEQEKLEKEEQDRKEAIRIKEAIRKHSLSEAEKLASMNRVREHFETVTSINRVHQHFMKAAQYVPDTVAVKRKRSSDESDDDEVDDTSSSIDRVHEHFLKMTQQVSSQKNETVDTSSSVKRVHEHFLKVSESTGGDQFINVSQFPVNEFSKKRKREGLEKKKKHKKKKSKNKNKDEEPGEDDVSLAQMHGKKKKKHLKLDLKSETVDS